MSTSVAMAMPTCEISINRGPNHVLITVSGVLDISGSDRLMSALEGSISNPELPLLLDFTQVYKSCSRVLRHLLLVRRRFPSISLMCICGPSSHMRQLINLTGLDRLVDIYDDCGTAIEAISHNGGRIPLCLDEA